MSQQINTVAYLHIAYGIFVLLGGFIAFFVLLGSGIISGDRTAIAVTSGIGLLIMLVLLVIGLPSLFAGYGLLRRREWARILAFIMSILALFSFPVGTAIGGYTLWVLSKEEVRAAFR